MAKEQKTINAENLVLGKLKTLVELTRPVNVAMVGVAIILSIFIALGEIAPFYITIPAILAAMFIAAAGNALNDYYDIEIDNINRPERPLPSGKITAIGVWAYALILFAAGIIFSMFLPLAAIIIAIVNSALLIVYASHLKKSGFLGNILVSYLVASVFAFGSVAVGKLVIGILLSVVAFFTNAAREVLKDMEDLKGDEMFGAKTIPILEGKNKSIVIISSFLITSILVSPLPYLLRILSFYYFIVVLIADVIFVLVVISLYKNSEIKNIKRQQQIIKIGALVGLMAFLIGAIPL